ncbi:cleavage stimulating factor 64 [Silene latifolia]|uniref:cleavage stimulating factor 64 n=1 Tax=Silene latifolia TaxID=37657 RepID=UPI003D77A350
MAANQLSGDGMASNLAGMSTTQLYEIMSQMKSLINQNQHQARQILVQNPLLTRGLFQAQIMLGMVKPSQAASSIQQPSPPVKTDAHVAQSVSSQVGLQGQANLSQANSVRKQPQIPPPMPTTSNPVQGIISQPTSAQPVEPSRGHVIPQATQMSHPKSSQAPNMPSLPHHFGSQHSSGHQPPMPSMLGHLQRPMQTTGVSHQMLQPPLPPQPRAPMQMQYQPQITSNVNFQNPGVTQMNNSQPMFHPSSRRPGEQYSQVQAPLPPGGHYSQGQTPLPNQPPLPSQSPYQPFYQGGTGNTMQMDRGNTSGAQLPTPPPLGPVSMHAGNQPRPAPLNPDVEQALIQQVMSLTQEQINLLPPEQRQQVLQLQQMLRQ